MKQILILNGPNLNLQGRRQTDIYGTQTFDELMAELRSAFPDVALSYFQSNHEGALIDKLHAVGFGYDGIVFNAGAYSHTSYALRDAIAAIPAPVVEVHLSNIYAREDFRHTDVIAPVCCHTIVGQGMAGYRQAVEELLVLSSVNIRELDRK